MLEQAKLPALPSSSLGERPNVEKKKGGQVLVQTKHPTLPRSSLGESQKVEKKY